MLKIEQGKYYKTRAGEIVGPMEYSDISDIYIWKTCLSDGAGVTYNTHGKYYQYGDNSLDLIEKIVIKENVEMTELLPFSLAEKENFTENDIGTEEWREYVYVIEDTGDSYSFRIEEPKTLYIKNDDRGTSHRIVDRNGVTHYPSRGWVGIRWFAPTKNVSF